MYIHNLYIYIYIYIYKDINVCVDTNIYIHVYSIRKCSFTETIMEHPIPCKQADSHKEISGPQLFYQVEKAEVQLQMQHNKQLVSMQSQLALARCLWTLAPHAALGSPKFAIQTHQHEPLYTICVVYQMENFKMKNFILIFT